MIVFMTFDGGSNKLFLGYSVTRLLEYLQIDKNENLPKSIKNILPNTK